jgi:hypothetical protein
VGVQAGEGGGETTRSATGERLVEHHMVLAQCLIGAR